MEFKDRIKLLREENKLTQSQLAAVLGKSEGAVRAWEIDRSKPDADTLIFLAGYFKCTTDYILGLSNIRNAEKEDMLTTITEQLISDFSRIDKGENHLQWFEKFFNLVLENDHQFIATAYITTAESFYFALYELYKLYHQFVETKSFEFDKFINCYLTLSDVATRGKQNIQLMSSYPIPWFIKLADDYGSELDKQLTSKFFNAYHTVGFESTTNIWPSAMHSFLNSDSEEEQNQ